MPKDRAPTYTAAPQPPSDPDLRRRYEQILAVIGERQTVAQAARELGMARNHFQTILHRGIAALIESITPKPPGRPARPEREAALEAENEQLRAQLEALKERSEIIERLMGVVGGIASGKTAIPRARSKKKKSEDPEPALRQIVTTMREANVPVDLCARVVRRSPSTIRRLSAPAESSTHPSPAREPDPVRASHVRDVVRKTHGLVGASSLGKMCGVSRRAAAGIKKRELREMELERKARCARVVVTVPGVVRGFDAMHIRSRDAAAYWLVAADGSVPYRTSIATVSHYDADNVVSALRADFETHGPPLVLRMDRIACQRTAEVEQLLAYYLVLALHGPPRHPKYYGQLERQNREHRAWYELLDPVSLRELADAGERMRTSLNALWLRPTLGSCTAEHAWRRRGPVNTDRRELRRDVDRRTHGLATSGLQFLDARRIAIESALTERGFLTINQGGWC